ncbi:molybdopterin-dependent oxidoreductase [Desulfotomaculum copahuensis]|uniref:DMSO reductase n=1 Tax=Desulfotomaculum copahuensis TaxID=1838280 RepID=A0A1B7LG69_9FIRM|nr:molybdopterin-dependent oxidoreductase [Desulfotomaculum copahuensis]OAT84829.1 DMSO reductase [Desulfotomaculum copahuensis]
MDKKSVAGSGAIWEKLITRRTFLKGTAVAGAAAAVEGLLNFDFLWHLTPAARAGSNNNDNKYQVFLNVCPRNCYDTCSILSYVQDGVLKKVTGNPEQTFTRGHLCAKGYTYTRRVYSPDRIKYPMRQTGGRGSGKWQRINWDEAMDVIARKILELKKRYGSTLPICLDKYSGNFEIMHYGIEGMMSSIGYTTRALGTPCWPAGIDAQTFDMGTLYSSDPEAMVNARYLILWGVNPAWTSIHSMHFVYEARKRGAKLVVIDPVISQTASKADLYVQINPSTDGALALGMARYILDHNLYDRDYLQNHVIGWEQFAAYLRDRVTTGWASYKTGVPQEVIETLAREYATAKPALIWIGYGMQRHTNGGQNVRAIDALAAITGNIGKTGGGANYGQLETWGFNYHAMGFKAPAGSKGVSKPDGTVSDRFIDINNFGHDVLAAKDPPVKMLWIACRNPLSQDPEAGVVEKAFRSMELVVTVDQFMNRSAQLSDIVLPATTQFEDWGVNASYWHYWVGINQQAIKPLFEAKSDVQIAMALSRRLNQLAPGSCTYPVDGDMQDWLGKEFNAKTYQMLGIQDWRELLKGPRKARLPAASWSDGKFRTPSGKYELYSQEAQKFGHNPLPVYLDEEKAPEKYPYRLLTPHWKLGLHSQFQNLDWMMSTNPEPWLEIHPDLAAAKGIRDGDMVKVFNDLGWLIIKARVTATVPPGIMAAYEAWYRDVDYNVNYTVKATPADMGTKATGNPGIAFHDNFIDITRA